LAVCKKADKLSLNSLILPPHAAAVSNNDEFVMHCENSCSDTQHINEQWVIKAGKLVIY